MSHNLGVIGVQVSWRTDTVYSLFPILFDTCVQLTASAGPFTPAKISRLSIGWVQDNVLTLGCPGMDASHALPSSSAGLSADHIPLYFICSLEHRAVVWKYSREMMHLEWWWGQTSGLNLVQVADENAAVCNRPELSRVQTWPRSECEWPLYLRLWLPSETKDHSVH